MQKVLIYCVTDPTLRNRVMTQIGLARVTQKDGEEVAVEATLVTSTDLSKIEWEQFGVVVFDKLPMVGVFNGRSFRRKFQTPPWPVFLLSDKTSEVPANVPCRYAFDLSCFADRRDFRECIERALKTDK